MTSRQLKHSQILNNVKSSSPKSDSLYHNNKVTKDIISASPRMIHNNDNSLSLTTNKNVSGVTRLNKGNGDKIFKEFKYLSDEANEKIERESIHNFYAGGDFGEEIVLRESQIPHATFLYNVLDKYSFCADYSPTGSGKTLIQLKLAKSYGLPIIVVSPLTLTTQWKNFCYQYGVIAKDIISYESLCTKNSKILDTYHISGPTPDQDIIEYRLTNYVKNILDKGCLFIFDEVHKIEHRSANIFKAASVITRHISQNGGQSRFSVLSASPLDKLESFTNLLQLFGLVDSSKMFRTENGRIITIGLQELFDRCEMFKFDNEKLQEFKDELDSCQGSKVRFTKAVADDFIRRLFNEVIVRNIGSRMRQSKELLKIPRNIFNGYFDLYYNNNNDIKTQICEMYTETINEINNLKDNMKGQNSFKVLNNALGKLQSIYAEQIAYYASKLLDDDKNYKQVIFLDRDEAIRRVCMFLDIYGIPYLKVTGKVKKIEKRQEMIDKFNEHNNDVRIIVMNSAVGSTGTNLQDTSANGQYPRWTWMVGNYKGKVTIQTLGRTYREGTTSPVNICFFNINYAVNDDIRTLTRIFDNLNDKGNTVESITNIQNKATECYLEEDIDLNNIKIGDNFFENLPEHFYDLSFKLKKMSTYESSRQLVNVKPKTIVTTRKVVEYIKDKVYSSFEEVEKICYKK